MQISKSVGKSQAIDRNCINSNYENSPQDSDNHQSLYGVYHDDYESVYLVLGSSTTM